MSNISTTATRTPYAVTNSTTGVSSSTPINTASSTTPVATASTTPNVSTTPPQGANVANTHNTGTVSASTTSAYGSSASNSSSKPVSSTTPCSSDSMSNSSSSINSSELSLPSIALNNGQNDTSNLGAVSGTIKDLIDLEYGDINEYMAEINALKDEDVFEGMTYEEIIQYRYENAVSDVCKKIYENYASCILVMNSTNEKITDKYYTAFNIVIIDKEEDALNETGYGSTYFHEVGHLIDDFSHNLGMTSNDRKYDFAEVLRSDFENYVSKIQDENGCSQEEAYAKISEYLWSDEDMTSAVSDIIMALTDRKAGGKYGHDSLSEAELEREAFADFFDAGMSYKTKKLEYVKEIFPNAYEVFEQMLWDDIQNMNSVEKNMNIAGKNMLDILISSHYIVV